MSHLFPMKANYIKLATIQDKICLYKRKKPFRKICYANRSLTSYEYKWAEIRNGHFLEDLFHKISPKLAVSTAKYAHQQFFRGNACENLAIIF